MLDKSQSKNISLYLKKYCELSNILVKMNEQDLSDKDLHLASPLKIYIEPTNRCNLSCSFCARDNMKRSITSMDINMFINIIDALPENVTICLTGNGEPLLNNKIYDMIQIASNKQMDTYLITNGTVLTDENIKKLAHSGLKRVQFSFDSLDKKTYEMTRRGANFEKTLLKILKFIKYVRSNNINMYISIMSVMTDEVKEHVDYARDFWSQLPIDNYGSSPIF